MKRDMHLIKTILEIIEDKDDGERKCFISINQFSGIGVSPHVAKRHMQLIDDEEYALGGYYSETGKGYDFTRLSWKGHDLLDKLREEEKAKTILKNIGLAE